MVGSISDHVAEERIDQIEPNGSSVGGTTAIALTFQKRAVETVS